jgi:cell wall-associated NlpC family hydrolase
MRFVQVVLVLGALLVSASPAHSALRSDPVPESDLVPQSDTAVVKMPDWVKPAVVYLDTLGHFDRQHFKGAEPMSRARFGRLMQKAFGGGYSRTKGKVRAAEVSGALARALGHGDVVKKLASVKSPDGWDPRVGRRFGAEVVARELGLRHDRPTSEEGKETSASEPMRQSDIVYGVWKALTSPATYSADVLKNFGLSNYNSPRRKVVKFAMSLVGTPYVWGGEWPKKTPASYPYGAQPHGGFDCSGFLWYVLRAKTQGWNPGRSYKGWSLPERSSSQMAGATKKKLSYRQLKPGDLMFFAANGRRSSAGDVYHAGMFLGRGWMIHSSGSRAGISLAAVGRGAWWHGQFTWGRRVIK